MALILKAKVSPDDGGWKAEFDRLAVTVAEDCWTVCIGAGARGVGSVVTGVGLDEGARPGAAQANVAASAARAIREGDICCGGGTSGCDSLQQPSAW